MKLAYKKKFYLSVVFTVFIFVFIFMSTISKTIRIVLDYKHMKEDLMYYDNTISKIVTVKNNSNSLESKMRKFNVSPETIQSKIVKSIGSFCDNNNILIKGITTPSVRKGNYDKILETRIITVRGDYFSILKLAYNIEQKYGIGRISSLHFAIQKSSQTNEDELYAYIYIQNILS
jgi:hypothetical protein